MCIELFTEPMLYGWMMSTYMYCRFARIRSERLQKSVVRITGKTVGGMVMSAEGNKKSAESSKKSAEGNKKSAEGSKKSAEGNKKTAEGSKKPRGKRSRVEEPPPPASILSHHPEGDGYK